MTKAELEQYIKDRVYPNNAQEITGEGLQEAMLQLAMASVENALSYGVQNLTEEEAEQARRNIGASNFLRTVCAVIKPDKTIRFYFTENQEFDKITFLQNACSLFVYNTNERYILLNTRSSDYTRSGIYFDELGFHEVVVAFDFDEGNNEVSVKSISDNIIPIRSINGTAVSLGTGEASGDFSLSQGTGTASGKHAVSLGTGEASGDFSLSQGIENFATAIGAIACGGFNRAEIAYSAVFGKNSKSTNKASSSIVAGENAVGEGYQCAVFGKNTHGKGNYTVVGGNGTVANNSSEVAFGQYNQSNNDTAFSIGNGNSTTRKNLVEIKKNGDVYINGKKVILTFEE